MVWGHGDKIKAFKKIVDSGNLGQAYLFFGDSEIGKKTFAHSLAYYLEYGRFEILDEPLIDFELVEPDDHGVIGIDAARGVKEFLWLTPLRSPRRFVLLDEADSLTIEAQSSFLKIVEEPPRSALIIFIARTKQTLTPPLNSRLPKIYFSGLPQEKVEKILVNDYGVPPEKAMAVAHLSFGRIGRALKALKEKKEPDGDDLLGELSREILNLRAKNVFGNAGLMLWLLEREVLLSRYNLNQGLQRKAISQKLITYNK